ncbi:MAG: MoaD/ThiS family protein [Chloroflexota bacterium]
MPVILIYRKQKLELEGTITVRDALKQLGLSPESHLVIRNGELLNENDTLRNGEEVKIVSAISGG